MVANADTCDDPLQAANLNGGFAQRRPAGGAPQRFREVCGLADGDAQRAPMLRQDHVDCNSSSGCQGPF